MATLTDISMFTANIHAMPCTNRCRHCWTSGSVEHPRVPMEQVNFVLDKLAEVRLYIPQVGFFLYDEPTFHPQFLEIMERAAELNFFGEEYFLATNGSILAKAPDASWSRLKNTGIGYFQFTFYGKGAVHDGFAGRKGAFQNLLSMIERANQHEIEWVAGVVLHAENVAELIETVAYIKGLDASGKARVSWFPFLWQGRGRDAGRVRENQYERSIPVDVRQRRHLLMAERTAVTTILEDPELVNRRASESMCPGLTFHVHRDLSVFCGGACDSGGLAAAVPELADAFYLGKLTNEGFFPLIDVYQQRQIPGLRHLDGITWGELAARYGDRENDEVFYLYDLPEHKWAATHLLKSV